MRNYTPEKGRALRLRLKIKRKCRCCGKKLNTHIKTLHCRLCLRKESIRQKAKRVQARLENNCRRCFKPKESSRYQYAYCQLCKQREDYRRLQIRKRLIQNALSLLKDQNFHCNYTGIKLIQGVNASLDHKIPRHRGGSNHINNLHWIDREINRMKGTLTHNEFLKTIQEIYLYTIHKTS